MLFMFTFQGLMTHSHSVRFCQFPPHYTYQDVQRSPAKLEKNLQFKTNRRPIMAKLFSLIIVQPFPLSSLSLWTFQQGSLHIPMLWNLSKKVQFGEFLPFYLNNSLNQRIFPLWITLAQKSLWRGVKKESK